MMKEFLTRLRFLLARRPHSDLDEEVQFHVEQSTAANIAVGMTPEEARRQALIAFGGVERAREECYEQRPGWLLGTAMQDVRYALRGFRRNPVFTVTVIATLALGIGATTAVFSVVDPILFRSLPYAHADRLVSVGLVHSLEKQAFTMGGFYYFWRDHQKPFEALTSEGALSGDCNLTERNPVQLVCARVEANFLPTLGILPLIGRNFLPEEDRPNGPEAALISYGLWRSHFNHDPGIVNKLIKINDNQVRVIGVLPRGFELPDLQAADILVPLALDEAAQHSAKGGSAMRTFARLKPGVGIQQAKAEMEPLFEYAIRLAPPAMRKEVHLSVRSIRDVQMGNVRLAAWVLLGTVFAVLLIACANVASLFMARGAARERELAVRSALGASRGRLVRQTLTEALLLSFAGLIAGLALAEILLRVFIVMGPSGILFLNKARLDLRIILFTVLLSLVCAALFGLMPALQKPCAAALAARSTNSGSHAALRRSLVVGQIAISMILLSGAALLLRSFLTLQGQALGMQTHGVLTANVSLSKNHYGTAQKQMEFYRQAEAALRRLPGITAVGLSDSLPPGGWHNGSWSGMMAVAGKPLSADGASNPLAWRWVTPDYFRVLNIPIVQGQNFTEEERNSSEHFIILSKLLAARLFPGENPLGQHIQPGPDKPGPDQPWYTVVGVAGNVKNGGLTGEEEPEYYRLRSNFNEDWDPNTWGTHSVITIEAAFSPADIAPWVRSQIAQVDAAAPVDIETLTQRVNKLADRPRFETALLGFFAFTGLLMAVIGLYGVISYVATQRTQEIGVRMALGASRFNILRLIAWEGIRLIALGSIVGLAAAFGMSRLLNGLLFSIGTHDPVSFIGVALLLAFVALVATLIPARSATKVEPVVTLRYE